MPWNFAKFREYNGVTLSVVQEIGERSLYGAYAYGTVLGLEGDDEWFEVRILS